MFLVAVMPMGRSRHSQLWGYLEIIAPRMCFVEQSLWHNFMLESISTTKFYVLVRTIADSGIIIDRMPAMLLLTVDHNIDSML